MILFHIFNFTNWYETHQIGLEVGVNFKFIRNKAILIMRRKSSLTENIYCIENQSQTNISKERRGKDFITFLR